MKTKYHYSVRILDGRPGQYCLENALNRAAHDGWDVLQLMPGDGGIVYLVLRKDVSHGEDED